jgi:uncharacterized peroxidase-related enzyme
MAHAHVAWIRTTSEAEATGYVKAVYDANVKARGWVSNIMKSFSLRPDTLRAFQNLFATLMFGPSELTRAQREMIATTVSVANRCHY